MSTEAKLTPRQRRFVEEYMIENNAVQAYRRAFPKCTYGAAATESIKLLKNPQIRRELWAARKAHARRCRVDADRVTRELAAIAFADIRDVFGDGYELRSLDDIPPATRRAIARMTVKVTEGGAELVSVSLLPKVEAIDKLARRLNLYRELPPLEMVLGFLPPEMAADIRRQLCENAPTRAGHKRGAARGRTKQKRGGN